MKKRISKQKKSFFVRFHEHFEDHYKKAIIIPSIFEVVAFITPLVLDSLSSPDKESWVRILYYVILWVSVVAFSLSFIFSILVQISNVAYKKYLDGLDFNNEKSLNFNLNLIENINDVCDEKLNTLIKVIERVKSDKMPPPNIIDEPCNQLRKIAVAIGMSVNYMLNGGILSDHGTNNDVHVNILYSLPNEKAQQEWQITHTNDFGYDGVNEILNDKNSLFNHFLNRKVGSIIRNDKQAAYEEGRYLPYPSEKDEYGALRGSILYYDMPIKNIEGRTMIKAVIMVYTCNKKFSEDNDPTSVNNAKYNIETVLLKFKSRIQIELSLYYLHYLYNRKNTTNS